MAVVVPIRDAANALSQGEGRWLNAAELVEHMCDFLPKARSPAPANPNAAAAAGAGAGAAGSSARAQRTVRGRTDKVLPGGCALLGRTGLVPLRCCAGFGSAGRGGSV